MAIQKLGKEDYHVIYSKVPRLCVDLVIETPEGIVFTKRTIEPYTGMWHFPGGGVELEEKLEEAVKRVAEEELSVEVEIIKSLGHIEDFTHQETKKHSVSIAFLCKIKNGEIKLNDQAEEVLITNEIPEDLIDCHKEFLKDLKKE